MNVNAQVKTISNLKQQRALFTGLTVVLAASNLLLALGVLASDKSVIIMPTHVSKEFVVSNKKVSQEYLELMGRDFIQSFLNMTPESQDYLNSYILRLAHPRYYGELKQQITELFEEIKSKQMALHFTLTEIEIDTDNLIIKASGYLTKYMGNREVEKKLRKYHIAFMSNDTRLLLKEFYEVSDEKEATD